MHTPPPFWFGRSKADLAQPPLAYEFPARVTIAPGTAPGPIRWQVANANGASAIATFDVTDMAEIIEPERNAAVIELPALPVVASGRISRISEIDHYRLTVAKAGMVICRLNDSIGQAFDGTLMVRDASGKIVADAADTAGGGLTVSFPSAAGAVYDSLAVHGDADHAGDRGLSRVPPHGRAGAAGDGPTRRWWSRAARRRRSRLSAGASLPERTNSNRRRNKSPCQRDIAARRLSLRVQHSGRPRRRHSWLVADAADALEPTSDDLAVAAATNRRRAPRRAASTALDPAFANGRRSFPNQGDEGEQLPESPPRQLVSIRRLIRPSPSWMPPAKSSFAMMTCLARPTPRIDFTAPADGVYTVIVTDYSGTEPSPTQPLSPARRRPLRRHLTLRSKRPTSLIFLLGGTADLIVKSQRVLATGDEPITLKLGRIAGRRCLYRKRHRRPQNRAAVKGAKPKVRAFKKALPGDIKGHAHRRCRRRRHGQARQWSPPRPSPEKTIEPPRPGRSSSP